MANSRTGKVGTPDKFLNYEKASVDTDPGTDGYGCKGVRLSDLPNIDHLTFAILTLGTAAEVTLQYSEDNVTFYDHPDSPYTAITIQKIDDKTLYWRGLVKDDKQGSSGASVFGIYW